MAGVYLEKQPYIDVNIVGFVKLKKINLWPFSTKPDYQNIGIHMGNPYTPEEYQGTIIKCKTIPMYWMWACSKTGKFLIRGPKIWGELNGYLPDKVWENWKHTGFSPKQYLTTLIPAKDQIKTENMKKINDKQRKVIEFFQTQLKFWENTSDIDSLTHYSDIREFAYQLHHTDSCFIVDDLDRIEAVARIIYQTIKGIK